MTKPIQKARSRLHSVPPSRLRTSSPQRLQETWRRHRADFQSSTQELRSSIAVRFTYWPLLVLAAMFYAGTALLLTRLHPEAVRHWLFPDSFLPFHILLFLGNFFFFTFLTVRKRWGLFLALSFQWLLILKLQGFLLDGWALLSASLIGAGGYGLRRMTHKQK